MSEQFLYQKFETLEQFGLLEEVPEYVEKNLSSNIFLREYQVKAFKNFVTHYEKNEGRNQIHTLFHMATGSGKTVIMAGLLFYLYKRGYRRFLFFVNQMNILAKTKDNFLNRLSNKYLFADVINIDGESIPIREVSNFSVIDEQAINICFSSTQKLHLDIHLPRENTLTIEDFEDYKIALISDESHHINTKTKRNKNEIEEEKTWEDSVELIFRANKGNVLIEFTATCDLKDPNVRRKYLDKIIFDYPLSKFRESGYTKDFQNLQNNYGLWERALLALLLSEYRRNLFAACKQQIKPVVLLKSQHIKDSDAFYKLFFERLEALKPEDLLEVQSPNNPYISEAFSFFLEKDSTLESLVHSIKLSFSKEHSIIMNGQSDYNDEKQILVNSLEENGNPYRIIFTVDMLNEGWDVLNLFDIVRLYETRQGSGVAGKIGSYTIKEAQLIGRGARYCPFVADEGHERFKRKYDHDMNNSQRILETMLYHSKQDSRYIEELKKALEETGLLPKKEIVRDYILKKSFVQTSFFTDGLVFSNRRVPKSKSDINQVDISIRTASFTIKLPGGGSSLFSLFEDRALRDASKVYQAKRTISEIPLNILYSAMECFEELKFSELKKQYPNLRSIKEFVTSPQYIGEVTLYIEGYTENLTGRDLLQACKTALQGIASHVGGIEEAYEGTEEFHAKAIKNVIRDKRVMYNHEHGDGAGASQTYTTNDWQLNLPAEAWYVFEDHFGTDEEKAFVKSFKGYVPILQETNDEIYLVRNERFADLAIFSFDEGKRFEPDFLLFLRKTGQDAFEQQQVYIEPKGNHLVGNDAERWKEEFLLLIEKKGVAVKNYSIDKRYHIIGMPFFNRESRMKEFQQSMNRLTKRSVSE